MTEDELPQTSRSHRWLGRGLVIGVAVLAGILISDLALSVQGPRYAATVTVRPLIDNPICIYSACPNQTATAGGYQWIIEQANVVQSKSVVAAVHAAIKGSPSIRTLQSNVRVRENNNSNSIDITYTGESAGLAQRLAVSFANHYADRTDETILDTLKLPTSTTQTAYQDLINAGLQRTPRGRALMAELNELVVADNLAKVAGGPPGSPRIYAPYPSLVQVTRTTPSILRATLLGAATGLVIGFAILLAMGSRRPRLPRVRRRAAAAGEA